MDDWMLDMTDIVQGFCRHQGSCFHIDTFIFCLCKQYCTRISESESELESSKQRMCLSVSIPNIHTDVQDKDKIHTHSIQKGTGHCDQKLKNLKYIYIDR